MEGLGVTGGGRRAPGWRGRRVLVTGHTGFKGSWLCLSLERLGARVWGYALAAPRRSLYRQARVGACLESWEGDIRDASRLARAFSVARPEVVFHLAAQPLVRRSYREPLETCSVNALGTAAVLEAARRSSARAIVAVTTDKVYDLSRGARSRREDDPLGGRDPYSASKACAELVAASWRASFLSGGAALATARAGNCIGGGDWAEDRLLPDLVRAAEAGRPAVLRYPRAVRPWQHVLEPVAGYLRLAEALLARGAACAEAWNFGPALADCRPAGWVARTFVDRLGAPVRLALARGRQPHEEGFLRLDAGKARRRLGWRPRWGVEEALARTAFWYAAWLAGGDVASLTRAQAAEHLGGEA